jgi:hypothetical protein
LHGVFANQKFAEMFKRANDSQLTSAQARFAEAVNPFISFDLHNELVAVAYPDR